MPYLYPIDISEFPGVIDLRTFRAEIEADPLITRMLDSTPTYISTTQVGVNFRAELPEAEQDQLLVRAQSHSGTPFVPARPVASTGAPIIIQGIDTHQDAPTLVSYNWCNKGTWYELSTPVSNDPLTTSDQLTYTASNSDWIDLREGALTRVEHVAPNYAFTVYKNGTPVSIHDLDGNGGECTVDPVAGTVTFDAALDPSDVVTADYHAAGSSKQVFKPEPGKMLIVRAVEVQFSTDIELTTATVFQVMANVEAVAPHLLDSNGGPLPAGTKIPVHTLRYPRMDNFIDEAQEAYPTIPKLGGNSWRGMQQPAHVFRWPYIKEVGSPVLLYSSMGMELHLYLEGDIPFNGHRATATIYARADDEA